MINQQLSFESRHNANGKQVDSMLSAIGVNTMDELIDLCIPKHIKRKTPLKLPDALSESQYLKRIRDIGSKNKIFTSFIGQGYYNSLVPSVIQRNILENPGWYTAYTPYQAEISQGRLEALINFQTMVIDITNMEIANASLLDEATAAAEAMTMLFNQRKGNKKNATKFLVDHDVFPQTLNVIHTRAKAFNIQIDVLDLSKDVFDTDNVFGVFFQYPNNSGSIRNWKKLVSYASDHQVYSVCATDLLALSLLTPPGEWGTDVVVGSSQRFGVPMGYGGPHAAFFATKEIFKRAIPGRIIGVSKDAEGNKAYRMALQTREQHIKKERATSNICTAQVLLAVMASMYAVYHGKEGLQCIAWRVHGLAKETYRALKKLGMNLQHDLFFDTLRINLNVAQIAKIKMWSEAEKINLRYFDDGVGISFDESHTMDHTKIIIHLFERLLNKHPQQKNNENIKLAFPKTLLRTSDYLNHPIFQQCHTEHELLRYMKRLENKDISLVHAMIPLGSCTMKLNATTEMIPLSWQEFGNIHPFVPKDQVPGYQVLMNELESWLIEITGFHKFSFQPNSGSQGEFAGLLAIRSYLESIGQGHRNVAVIPSSAHGTNPASAVMAGLKVVMINCDEKGNIDLSDLKEKILQHKDYLAALMVTYPSTHGVFETSIVEICDVIHQYGGQVYMDGANMNAQVGLTSPNIIKADVCHLNLHKTFCIPHGGGGPGMGPIGVAKHLVPFLPDYAFTHSKNTVAAAPYSSASILTISHAYISMMGGEGLTHATKQAILNANYVANQLKPHYPVLYTNEKGKNAHEFIIDCRAFKKIGIEVEDIAKRLIDYGYHAPTVSFPVAGTLMIEPTESEEKKELDRFCDAMIEIRKEIQEIFDEKADKKDNVLKNAPHTHQTLINSEWKHPYTREKAAYPLPYVKENKFWSAVGRIDNAYGDRNLVCNCFPIS